MIFQVNGSLRLGEPNTVVSGTAFGFGAGGIVTLLTASNDSRNILGLVAEDADTSLYGRLNDVQCDVSFAPMNFSVSVNKLSRTHFLSPQDEDVWPSYGT